MTLDRVEDSQLGAVAREDLAVFGLAVAAERVGENIEVGGDPLGSPLEAVRDLRRRKMPGHFQPNLVTSTAILEQVKTCGRICFTSDLMFDPGRAPEISSDDVGQQFQVGDVEVLEVGGRAAGDVFIIGKVENSNTWEASIPSI